MILDCVVIQNEIKKDLLNKIQNDECNMGPEFVKPRLAIITVGNDVGNTAYIKQKAIHGQEAGIDVIVYKYKIATFLQLEKKIKELNDSKMVHGIILQQPLIGIGEKSNRALIETIDPLKDVDCLTSTNIGLLAINTPNYLPCTPGGILEIFNKYNIKLEGKNVLIIGRSEIVGKPMAVILTQKNATVTLAHSKTKNIEYMYRDYDIIISAVGKANFIGAEDMLCMKEDVVIIDVGMNRDDNGKLCGDIAKEVGTYSLANYTPVPGGVGRTTVAQLLLNTYDAFIKQREACDKNEQ
ncbi:MAG: bifunctional 5,10-methylenetetrahydrofolate dehydrogenase/5,10-methenyltetrahydrofolate cyclohydrolase [Cetobacterium sp.]